MADVEGAAGSGGGGRDRAEMGGTMGRGGCREIDERLLRQWACAWAGRVRVDVWNWVEVGRARGTTSVPCVVCYGIRKV